MEPLVTLLIGHRGVGKTTLLHQLKKTFSPEASDWRFLDLDEEIARQERQPVSEVFARGEVEFRQIERALLSKLVAQAQSPTWIAIGAGFEAPFPEAARVIWIRRSTDSSGRVFLNRPRLNPKVSGFAEYLERFAARERGYRDGACETLFLPEGYESGLESFFAPESVFDLPYELTLSTEHLENWDDYWSRRQRWNLRHLEVRDDLLSPSEIQRVLASVPKHKILFSCRKGVPPPEGLSAVDWALELGSPKMQTRFVSLHERSRDLQACFEKIKSVPGAIQKLAVEIRDFNELIEGHRWWLEAPARRAFLPRSPDGRWRWYRSLFGPRMPLHFFREDEGSALDQPFLWQCILQKPFHQNFAAILGSPVSHSRTPCEQAGYFNFPVVAIDISERQWPEAFPVLRELGLKAAAVTAPLKQAALGVVTRPSAEVAELSSCNTLWIEGDEVWGHNTDVLALKSLREELGHFPEVWLWGGGGVKPAVKAAWPKLEEISARQGTTNTSSPDLLIWAVGRSRGFQWPPETCRPRLVLDLNYGEDSPGLEWAARQEIPYQSGLRMFKLQAEFQREFWRQRECL